ncbi:MAG TPA: hypothetical protein VGL82_12085 [Bryobacteraceae bacterium]
MGETVRNENRVVHACFDIDLDIVWDSTVLDLPPLIAALTELMNEPRGYPPLIA